MNETELAQSIIKWVKKNGGDAWHVHGSAVQRAGEPDLDGAIILHGALIHFKIELKIGNNKASALQHSRLRNWKKYGYCVGVARSLPEFIQILEGYITYEGEPCGAFDAHTKRLRSEDSNGNSSPCGCGCMPFG